MSRNITVEPDLGFVKEIQALGGETLKKCYQCATCSVVCNLSPDEKPYPRKEMIWTQWGWKEQLVKDPDVWLCHHCNDCSTYCPRGAKPGDVLGALRSYTIKHYAIPSFLGKWVSDKKYLWVLFAIPILLLLFAMGTMGTFHIPEGEIHFAHMFPHLFINTFFTLLVGLAFLMAVIGVFRFWKGISENPITGEGKYRGDFIGSIVATVKELLLHTEFSKCDTNMARYYGHLGIFYGFVGLFITTGLVVVMFLFGVYPLPLWHPLKVLGNISAALFLLGILLMLYYRYTDPDQAEKNTYYDMLFLWVLLGVAGTGILTETFRFAHAKTLAYPTYFVHLVFIFFLLVYMPYTKFAHMFYRFVALVHQRYYGRTE